MRIILLDQAMKPRSRPLQNNVFFAAISVNFSSQKSNVAGLFQPQKILWLNDAAMMNQLRVEEEFFLSALILV